MSENLIKINEIAEDFSNIEVKQYLSYPIKRIIIDNILDSCVSENSNGLRIIDYSFLHMIKTFKLINEYTNLDFSEENLIQAYDQLCEKGVLDYVLGKINKSELEFFNEILNQEINQIHTVDNSVSGVLAKGINKSIEVVSEKLDKLIEKIPDEKGIQKLLKLLPKEVNKINPESIKLVAEALAFNKGIDLSKGDK